MDRMTHLHVHTDNSIKDGMGKTVRLVKAAKQLGADHLAMTDHGTLAGTVTFVRSCESLGIKPIVGLEGYVNVDNEIGHITLLSTGNNGFENLTALNNLAHTQTIKGRPTFSIDQLIAHEKGLLVLTGCPASPLNRMSQMDAFKLAGRLKQTFGHRLFAELMFNGEDDTWTRPLEIASRLGIKPVVTNDTHFAYETDAPVHSILTSLKSGFSYNSDQLWLKNITQMKNAIIQRIGTNKTVFDALNRTYEIGKRIQAPSIKRNASLPHIANSRKKLKTLIEEGIKLRQKDVELNHGTKYLAEWNAKIMKRIQFEFQIIAKMDYATYFVILHDVVGWSKNQGIKVGPGRGSGGGSLILYLLFVTDIEPMFFGLTFERFLNPGRKSMPDVDIDFDSIGKPKVVEYAKNKYNAVPIVSYSTYKPKALLADLGKMFKVPKARIEEAKETLKIDDIESEFPGFENAFNVMKGQIRHKSRHAGGVIIAPDDLVIPIEKAGDGLVAAWSQGMWHDELEYAGAVKFDFLGLTSLTGLRYMEEIGGTKAPYPSDGHPAMSIFQEGDVKGIFQFSGSSGIRKLTKMIKPDTFDEIIAAGALFRPGALDAGTAWKYPEWKNNPRKFHPLIDDLLAETYGIIIYQEQVMAIFQRISGGTLADADIARRIVVKSKRGNAKWEKQIKDLGISFVSNAIAKGMTDTEANDLWSEIQTHSRYSFNKAHSTAYAYIAWEMAWWKYTNPHAFYTAMMIIDPDGLQSYAFEAASRGLSMDSPHINSSSKKYETDGSRIYMPLGSIKFLGGKGVNAIIKAREDGKFTSVGDFMKRVPKRLVTARARAGLYAVGAFSGLPGEFEELHPGKNEVNMRESKHVRQRKFMGVVAPDEKMYNTIMNAQDAGFNAGMVIGRKDKKSKHGTYSRIYLAMGESCWIRHKEHPGLSPQNGDLLVARTNKNGKVIDTYPAENFA